MLIVAFLLHLLCLSYGQDYDPGLIGNLLSYLNRGVRYFTNEPPDAKKILPKYDFIIVGAGSAGCVLANRLTEIAEWNVLLIEAGGPESMLMNIPLLAPVLQFTDANWGFLSEPTEFACKGMKGGRCPIPRGRVMGGSSVLNFMVYTRGDKRDYDHWAELGNTGWSWDDVEPYFMKSEDVHINDNWIDKVHHRNGGYLSVDTAPYKSPLVTGFVKAGAELGYKVRDYNSGNIEGFSYVQSTVKNGARMSTSQAYLHPVHNRKNLHVVKRAMVTKVLIENGKAVGVIYNKGKKKYTVRVSKEVILSAGAINSPQLLMLSGIGPASHLKEKGIPVVKNLPVGYNLQDHPVIGYVIFTVDKAVGLNENVVTDLGVISNFLRQQKGQMTITGGLEGLAFVDVFNGPRNQQFPNLEIQFCISSPLSIQFLNANFGVNRENFQIYKSNGSVYSYLMFMNVMRPKSRGRVWLASKNPKMKPKIDLGFLNHPDDVKVLVKGVELAKNLSNTGAMQQFGSKLYDKPIPPCAHLGRDNDRYWECHARHLTVTNYHQSGTTKMGPIGDPTSVVDPRLRVIGIKGLRVIDASIIPVLMSAHTNAPVIMIAEKGADMIKQDWGQ
ncbi:glucose dehydrogenase [FAD, quinone]-like isoform X2 [Cimex lectularius]|uniref:Glucose-methanol-choline oxidoreductase N-terminal domain-containing protein n=1 Tax=Cimex lectularius TaxID=79782 RepID=A0A8I6REC5_CIMLE|nr:glucose dehydrogenase [FAD, quinone]-like isoform X2 [Cimex lectularius]